MGHKTVTDIGSFMEMMPDDPAFRDKIVEELTGLTPEQITLGRRSLAELASALQLIPDPELQAMIEGHILKKETEFALLTLGTTIVRIYLRTGQKEETQADSSG